MRIDPDHLVALVGVGSGDVHQHAGGAGVAPAVAAGDGEEQAAQGRDAVCDHRGALKGAVRSVGLRRAAGSTGLGTAEPRPRISRSSWSGMTM